MFMSHIYAALQQDAVKIWGKKPSDLVRFLLSPLSWPQNNCYLSVFQTNHKA